MCQGRLLPNAFERESSFTSPNVKIWNAEVAEHAEDLTETVSAGSARSAFIVVICRY
jgi:hypothetical protein